MADMRERDERFMREALAEARAAAAAKAQGAPDISVQVFCDDIVEKIGWRERYIETRVKAVAKATTLKLKMQEEKDERRP